MVAVEAPERSDAEHHPVRKLVRVRAEPVVVPDPYEARAGEESDECNPRECGRETIGEPDQEGVEHCDAAGRQGGVGEGERQDARAEDPQEERVHVDRRGPLKCATSTYSVFPFATCHARYASRP